MRSCHFLQKDIEFYILLRGQGDSIVELTAPLANLRFWTSDILGTVPWDLMKLMVGGGVEPHMLPSLKLTASKAPGWLEYDCLSYWVLVTFQEQKVSFREGTCMEYQLFLPWWQYQWSWWQFFLNHDFMRFSSNCPALNWSRLKKSTWNLLSSYVSESIDSLKCQRNPGKSRYDLHEIYW